jgi:hypothetical protein
MPNMVISVRIVASRTPDHCGTVTATSEHVPAIDPSSSGTLHSVTVVVRVAHRVVDRPAALGTSHDVAEFAVVARFKDCFVDCTVSASVVTVVKHPAVDAAMPATLPMPLTFRNQLPHQWH